MDSRFIFVVGVNLLLQGIFLLVALAGVSGIQAGRKNGATLSWTGLAGLAVLALASFARFVVALVRAF